MPSWLALLRKGLSLAEPNRRSVCLSPQVGRLFAPEQPRFSGWLNHENDTWLPTAIF